MIISKYRSLYLPGKSERLVSQVIKEVRKGTINPELILLGVPEDRFTAVINRLQNDPRTKDMRLVVTNTTDSNKVIPIGTTIHWVDVEQIDDYLRYLS